LAQLTKSVVRVPVGLLLVLFVLSGAAGLIYEVVWARQLVLVFGNTSQAVSTILTGFFGGLALGGWFGGRLADRVPRPLRLYGLLELVVVVIVVLTPLSFRLIGELYRGVYPALAEAPLALALVRFALAILALAPATIVMGATLPTLTRFLTQDGSGLGASFQRLYFANTVGAILGTVIAGFVLIELFGLTGALLVGAACSATAGLVALLLDWRTGPLQVRLPSDASADAVPNKGAKAGPGRAEPAAGRAKPDMRRLALALAFASGLTSLGYQVVWNRLVGAGTGSSTYVFTIILALFLSGIAIGAALVGPLRPRIRPTTVLIGGAQLLTTVLVVAGSVVLSSPKTPFNGGNPLFIQSLRDFTFSTALIVLPATIAMGITFPATASLLGDDRGHEGTDTGALLAVNTAGSLVATFVLPFFVIPLIGSPATLALLAIINAALGAWLFLREGAVRPQVRRLGGLAGAGAVGLVVVAYASSAAFGNPTVAMLKAGGGEVWDATEDEIASVVAGTLHNSPQVWVAGTSMTAITVDTKFMPLLPLAMRPDAKRGLTIAFGMGTAFRTSLIAGVKTDAVELVPSVPGMFHWYYPDADQVLANPNGRMIIADGRNHVELTDQTYDFIVVDPPPPIESSGVSVISTVEFYEASKARLNPGGVMVQWVPYGQSQEEFLAHVRSFLQAFPNVRVIAGAGGFGFYLIGSEGSVDLTSEGIQAILERPGVLEDVNSAPDSQNRTAAAWGSTLMDRTWAAGDQLRTAVGDGPLITDDRPLPEYFLIRRLADPYAPGPSLPRLRALLQ
jgi:spermidine synthase